MAPLIGFMPSGAIYRFAQLVAPTSPTRAKQLEEFAYWRERVIQEGVLKNSWYERAFTSSFGIDSDFYRGVRMLDIGCGPRGSLEWANEAAERIGLDPLARAYRLLGTTRHQMKYVAGSSEDIRFPDGHFDVVSSFNSLDHVDDLGRSVHEISRVLKAGGTFLLATDVNHAPTRAEPQAYSWDVVNRFQRFTVKDLRRYEKHPNGIYASLEAATSYDDENGVPRYGVLLARLTRDHDLA